MPICQAMKKKLSEYDPAINRQIIEISQWTQDIRHKPGKANAVSHWLSLQHAHRHRLPDA